MKGPDLVGPGSARYLVVADRKQEKKKEIHTYQAPTRSAACAQQTDRAHTSHQAGAARHSMHTLFGEWKLAGVKAYWPHTNRGKPSRGVRMYVHPGPRCGRDVFASEAHGGVDGADY